MSPLNEALVKLCDTVYRIQSVVGRAMWKISVDH